MSICEALMILTRLCASLFLLTATQAIADSGRYDETGCGSSRLRIHGRSELLSLNVSDDRQPSSDVEIDLSGDGLTEYLSGSGCGNAGCGYAIYLQERPNEYRCIGEVSLHAKGFIRLVESRHNDFFDLLVYSRENAENGSLLRLAFDGRRYNVVHQLKGKSADLFPLIQNESDSSSH